MSAAYPTPVESLSDEELATLSAEIEAQCCLHEEDGDDDWCGKDYDPDATDRFFAMRREIARRAWEALTPEERKAQTVRIRLITDEALGALARNMAFAKTLSRDFEGQFSKIGSPIHLRTPPRYRG